jgi:hypothetical protein
MQEYCLFLVMVVGGGSSDFRFIRREDYSPDILDYFESIIILLTSIITRARIIAHVAGSLRRRRGTKSNHNLKHLFACAMSSPASCLIPEDTTEAIKKRDYHRDDREAQTTLCFNKSDD